jgi:CRP-like cAMP-binding protein
MERPMAHHDLDTSILEKHSKLFSLLDEEGRQRILDAAMDVAFESGEVMIQEGESGEEFFILLEGRVDVLVDDMGNEKKVAELGRGAVFGEIATIMGEPRSATIKAIEKCRVLGVGREPVNTILEDYPQVKEILIKLGLKRSEDTINEMLNLDSKEGAATDES